MIIRGMLSFPAIGGVFGGGSQQAAVRGAALAPLKPPDATPLKPSVADAATFARLPAAMDAAGLAGPPPSLLLEPVAEPVP